MGTQNGTKPNSEWIGNILTKEMALYIGSKGWILVHEVNWSLSVQSWTVEEIVNNSRTGFLGNDPRKAC